MSIRAVWDAEGLTAGTSLANNAVITGSGTGVNPSVVKSANGTLAGTRTAAEIIHGASSLKISAPAESNYLIFDLGTAVPAVACRAYFYFPAAPAAEQSLILAYTPGTPGTHAEVTLRTDGRFRFNGGAAQALYSTAAGTGAITFPAVVGIDFTVQPNASTTTGQAQFRIYKSKALDAAPDDTMPEVLNGNFDAAPIQQLRIGKTGAAASGTPFVMMLDSVEIRDTYALIGPLSSNTAPLANAGADQTGVEPWSTVTLTGTDTDTENNVTTRAWAQTSGTAVTLTGSGATRTFTAPATIGGATLTFTYTATDSGGLSGSDSVNVTVLPVTERAVIGGVEVPMQVRAT